MSESSLQPQYILSFRDFDNGFIFFLMLFRFFCLTSRILWAKATDTDVEAPKCYTSSLTLSQLLLSVCESRHKMSPQNCSGEDKNVGGKWLTTVQWAERISRWLCGNLVTVSTHTASKLAFTDSTNAHDHLKQMGYIYFLPSQAENNSKDELFPVLRNQKGSTYSWRERDRLWPGSQWVQWRPSLSGMWFVVPQEEWLA